MNLPPNPGFNRRHVGVCAGVVSRHNAFRTHQHAGDPAPKPAANGRGLGCHVARSVPRQAPGAAATDLAATQKNDAQVQDSLLQPASISQKVIGDRS